MKNNKNLSKINFKVLSISSIEEDNSINPKDKLSKLLQHGGYPWISERFCSYPQEIIIQFDSPSHLYQINVLSHDKKISRRLTFFSFSPIEYDNKKYNYYEISFKEIGFVDLKDNIDCDYKVREYKKIFVNIKDILYLKIKLSNNFVNNYNKFQQIGLLNIEFLGDKINNFILNKNINLNSKDKDKQNIINENIERIIREICGINYDILLKKLINTDKKDNKDEYSTIKNKLEEINNIGKKIYQLKLLEKDASNNDDFDKAIELKNKINKLKHQLNEILKEINNNKNENLISNNSIEQLTSGGEINIIKNNGNQNYILKENNYENENKRYQKNALPSLTELDLLKDSSDYDDVIIPTHNKKLTKNKSQAELNNEEEDKYKQKLLPLEKLNEEDLEQYKLLIPYLKEEGLQMLLSNQISYKIKGFEILKNELNNIFSNLNSEDLIYELINLENLFLEDKNNSSLVKSFQLIKDTFLQIMVSESDIKSNKKILKYINDRIINKIISYLGDGEIKVRKGASDLFLFILSQNIFSYNSMITNLLNNDINQNSYNSSFNNSQNLKIYSKLNIIKNILQDYENIIDNNYSTKNTFPKDIILDYIFMNIKNNKLEIKSIIRELISIAVQIFGLEKVKKKLDLYIDDEKELKKLASQINELKPLIHSNISKSHSQINIHKANPSKIKLKKNASQVNIKNNSKNLKKPINIKNNSKNTNKKEELKCELCHKILGNIKKAEHLKKCLMCCKCDECGENVKVENLNYHKLNVCKNKNKYKQCNKCKEAIEYDIFDLHIQKNMCNASKQNMNRCPLCHHDIEKSKDGFYQHLVIDGCAYQTNKIFY